MGEISIITKQQKIVLDEIVQNDYLKNNFYFSGGTALSAIYLKHRYSDDLDFFSESQFENQVIFSFIEDLAKKYGFTFKSRFVEMLYSFDLSFFDSPLRVDFAFYPYKKTAEEVMFNRVRADSLKDIAVNKLLTISQRTDVKDFVDLMFLLEKFSLSDLINGVKQKFGVEVELYILASDFMKAEDFQFLPRMIKQLSLEKLKEFYTDQAKKIGKEFII